MKRWVPLEVFESVENPILVSDEEGRVEFCNRAAVSTFAYDPRSSPRRFCWEVARLRGCDGKRICRSACPVLRKVRSDGFPDVRTVFLRASTRQPAARLSLHTYPISPPRGSRVAVLHLLQPSREEDSGDSGAGGWNRHGRLEDLSPREREVLRRLADGRPTEQIAEELFISPVTVRNHVHSILAKLSVHHRIEAVLEWLHGSLELEARAPESPPRPSD